MPNIGTISFDITANAAGLEKAVANTQRSFDKMLKNTTKVSQGFKRGGMALSKAVTLPALAIGAIGVKAFADFDSKMVKSTAIMGDVSDAMKGQMADAARQVARDTVMSASDAAESYFFLASAGLNASQSIAALPQVAKFAQAGMFDMATATDLATDAQSAIGLKSADAAENLANLTRMTDVLAKSNVLANANMAEFSQAMISAGPEARKMGLDVEKVSAMLAVMADQGKKGAEAGNMLKFTLPQMAKAARDNEEQWKKMGIAMFDANGNMLPMADIADNLTDKFGDMAPEMVSAELAALGLEGRMGSTVGMFIGAGDDLRRFEKELRNAGGTVDEIAKKQLESFSNQLKLLKNNLMDLAIDLGETLAPALMTVSKVIGKAAEWWRKLDDGLKRNIVIVVAVAAALGPLLLAFGTILGFLPMIVSGFGIAVTAIGTLSGVIPVVLALVAAVATVWFVFKRLDEQFNIVDGTINLVKDTWNGLMEMIGLSTDKVDESTNALFKWENAWQTLLELPKFLAIEAAFAFETMMTIGEVAFTNLFITVMNWWNGVSAVFSFMLGSWENVLTIMSMAIDVFFTNIENKFGLIGDLLSGDIGVKDFAKQFGELTINPLKGLKDNLKNVPGLEIPVDIPLENLGDRLAEIARKKDEAIEGALAINIEAAAKQDESAKKASAVADKTEESANKKKGEPVGSTKKVSEAIEAGSVEAFKIRNKIGDPGDKVEKEQLDEQTKNRKTNEKALQEQEEQTRILGKVEESMKGKDLP